MRALVTGAGGFIGHHLVKRLKAEGHWVRGVDIRCPNFEATAADDFVLADLREYENCVQAVQDVTDVYHLAADMGGVGYLSANRASVARNNVLIDSHMLEAAAGEGECRFFYASSACVYPAFLQVVSDVTPMKERDAMPADPEEGYGWEKLFAERLAEYYGDERGLDVRIARFHNIYGPLGDYRGGREKAPAALCRKVASVSDGGAIEIWGDGQQTRSFCYIDDCIEGIRRIMESGCRVPLNLGSEELVTIDELVELVCRAAGKRLRPKYNLEKPQGVRGRSSDNTLLRHTVGWQPGTPLSVGIARTYQWIAEQIASAVQH